jgi:hypothetical protein
MAFDLLDHARARQQRDAATRGSQHAADEAADAAGPCHANRSVHIHLPFNLMLASVAELAPSAYRGRRSTLPIERARAWAACLVTVMGGFYVFRRG